jgi:predicted NAD/FAD-binding protein
MSVMMYFVCAFFMLILPHGCLRVQGGPARSVVMGEWRVITQMMAMSLQRMDSPRGVPGELERAAPGQALH